VTQPEQTVVAEVCGLSRRIQGGSAVEFNR